MIIDDSFNFESILTSVFVYLNITVYLLAKWNAKSLSVKRFHRILDKITTTTSEDRGRQQSNFTAVAAVTTFIMKIATFDNTNVVQSIVAIGRPFSFPLDIELAKIPSPIRTQPLMFVQNLRLVCNNHRFATEILKVLFDERRENHRERVNRCRSQIFSSPGIW